MEQAVEYRGGEHRIPTEDLTPFGEALIAGKDRRQITRVALADDLEERELWVASSVR